MNEKPIISIVLGTYNRKNFLKETIKSIRNNNINVPYEIIVIDGGSSDGSLKYLLNQKDIITIIQHNRGVWKNKPIQRKSWGYFMNIAFKACHGSYIVMLSDDCIILPNSIMNAYEIFLNNKNKKIGAVAFYFRDYPIQKYYSVLYTFKHTLFVNHGMYLKKALVDVGYIDEDNYEFYYADGDLCAKIWTKGYKILDSEKSVVEHFFHANEDIRSSNYLNKYENFETFKKTWRDIFYTPEIYNVRAKKNLNFVDPLNTAKIFDKIYKSRLDYYKELINTYLHRGDRLDQEKIRVSIGIIIKFQNEVLLEKKYGKYYLPKIDNLDRDKYEDYFMNIFEKKLFETEHTTKLLGQSGLRPENEIYFFLIKFNNKINVNLNSLDVFMNNQKDYEWTDINQLNNQNTNPNHIPFINME
ncbi:MAG: hypothetical protein A2431_04160 [Candidatus Zambryskibacteria bacterium RIFOXYC1_FULL_39_10]|uniref:Glycosyltransferase 2-like domain-containing protein n=1 Tax=Candidatus Zambryskibacteria bacterium RIFOXYC1_FULL_39_10 TaxID=1802779 RepID=A0A1G2UZ33_9BACT|nr:MAG: hypothetical protein A2431_04160 [Candidatus Zambryskibacteria bacterium RIFOXYC1_FULL_39_10]OHB16662.1 MAG: hypothetical protein A2605_00700 [Candidatus Zambryskibacteria bacterium RIFOXYD1_FULL_39_35]